MRTLYDLLEDPTSSQSAFAIHVFTTSLIIISAIITILETLPPFARAPSGLWFGLETALVVCFTVEFACRAYAHSASWSEFWRWLWSFFAIVDLLAVVPYYVEIAIQADTTAFFRFSILRTFRLLRVFRPFKYSSTILLCVFVIPGFGIDWRLFRTIEVMYLSMKRSKDALFALFFFALVVLVVFSTLLYFAERGTWDEALETFIDVNGDPSEFASIPGAAWFVLVTITTVGYGEMLPHSILGRLFTLPLLLFGLLLIALPSFVLGREFSALWETMAQKGGVRRCSRQACFHQLR
ncbi:voltage-gated potassium channel [Clavulina sp. PMI_390]|nr:voltage-gated potassium channel [Clavulina sp. PMI_390]